MHIFIFDMITSCPLPENKHFEKLNPVSNIQALPNSFRYEKVIRTGKKIIPVPENAEQTVDEWREWCITQLNGKNKPRKASVNKWYRESSYEIEGLRQKCLEHVEKWKKQEK